MTDVWTYERFEENVAIGECEVCLDERQLALWRSVNARVGQSPKCGDAIEDAAPGGLLVALAMRGYLSIVQPRPPGNVHASSVLRWGTVAACVGEPLRVSVSCVGKSIARERRWVSLLVRLVNRNDALVLSSELKMVWAA
ncbi:hypothetical protein [Paraburkholderia sp. BCC1886]|uniref:hypothetical protein n=1 Tax=Paraburkholderia sp. BCC1886 TaxID=2562670 RepID=UPI00118239D4|nr:hypothetical protein [Paraburkholderia sp. BCC1886]